LLIHEFFADLEVSFKEALHDRRQQHAANCTQGINSLQMASGEWNSYLKSIAYDYFRRVMYLTSLPDRLQVIDLNEFFAGGL